MTTTAATPLGSRTALGVSLLALAATVAVLAPVPEVGRAVAVAGFTLLGPGAAIASVLRVRSGATWLLVTVTGSIAVVTLASELAALTTWWHPTALLVVLAASSAAVAVAAGRRATNLTVNQDGAPTCT